MIGPNQERSQDIALLEAARPAAEQLLERHYQRREPWHVDEKLPPQEFGGLLTAEHTLALSDAELDAVAVFDLTEDGITWFPGDVMAIYNPWGKQKGTQKGDSDVYVELPHTWTAEEQEHGLAGHQIAMLVGVDMTKLAQDRHVFVESGNVPHFEGTADGIAYTAQQEANTSKPYVNLVRNLKVHLAAAVERGDEVAATIVNRCMELYRLKSQDERLHRAIFSGIGSAALKCGDPNVSDEMLAGVERQIHIKMPGRGIPNFVRRSVGIERAGIFTREHMAASAYNLIMRTWGVDKLTGLGPRGSEIQNRICARMGELALKYPGIASSTSAE